MSRRSQPDNPRYIANLDYNAPRPEEEGISMSTHSGGRIIPFPLSIVKQKVLFAHAEKLTRELLRIKSEQQKRASNIPVRQLHGTFERIVIPGALLQHNNTRNISPIDRATLLQNTSVIAIVAHGEWCDRVCDLFCTLIVKAMTCASINETSLEREIVTFIRSRHRPIGHQ